MGQHKRREARAMMRRTNENLDLSLQVCAINGFPRTCKALCPPPRSKTGEKIHRFMTTPSQSVLKYSKQGCPTKGIPSTGRQRKLFEDAVNEQEFAPDAILAHMSERKPLPPGDLKRLLSQPTRNKDTTDNKDQQPAEIEVNGTKHRQTKMRRLRYHYMDRTPSSRVDNHGDHIFGVNQPTKGQ